MATQAKYSKQAGRMFQETRPWTRRNEKAVVRDINQPQLFRWDNRPKVFDFWPVCLLRLDNNLLTACGLFMLSLTFMCRTVGNRQPQLFIQLYGVALGTVTIDDRSGHTLKPSAYICIWLCCILFSSVVVVHCGVCGVHKRVSSRLHFSSGLVNFW